MLVLATIAYSAYVLGQPRLAISYLVLALVAGMLAYDQAED